MGLDHHTCIDNLMAALGRWCVQIARLDIDIMAQLYMCCLLGRDMTVK